MRTFSLIAGATALLASLASAHKHHTDGTTEGTTHIANSSYNHFDCGTHLSSASHHFNQTIAALHSASHSASSGSHLARLHARTSSPINVNTVFHIITKNSNAGSITQEMANAQLVELNKAYNPSGVNFTLLATTFSANDAWAVGLPADMTAMQTALRQGSYSTLNIYFHTDLTGGILGTCSLPSNIGTGTPARATYAADGCSVSALTMPGGAITGYNLGKTAVHETGHWMGLLHTFEGYSCSGTGDFIADTPVQSTSTDGCPVKPAKDSCPGSTGVDAVHNYMDYSTDVCYTGFTKGQQARMQDLWAQYRLGK